MFSPGGNGSDLTSAVRPNDGADGFGLGMPPLEWIAFGSATFLRGRFNLADKTDSPMRKRMGVFFLGIVWG